MKRKSKVWMIVGALLSLLGVAIFTVAMCTVKWDFRKLSTVNFQTNSYEITSEFTSISLNGDTENIEFVKSLDGKTKVVCNEEENSKHDVKVENGTLKISRRDTNKKLFDFISINFYESKVTVYLPEVVYKNLAINVSTGDVIIPSGMQFENVDIKVSTGDVSFSGNAMNALKIVTSTGDITVSNASASSMSLTVSTGDVNVNNVNVINKVEIKTSTGDVKANNVNCNAFVSKSSTGDDILSSVIAIDKIQIDKDTGDVKINKCDAQSVSITTSTGDVSGSFKSSKIFFARTSTGEINVPRTTSGGICEITTDTGDINIVIES